MRIPERDALPRSPHLTLSLVRGWEKVARILILGRGGDSISGWGWSLPCLPKACALARPESPVGVPMLQFAQTIVYCQGISYSLPGILGFRWGKSVSCLLMRVYQVYLQSCLLIFTLVQQSEST